jgi:hypothetical protein
MGEPVAEPMTGGDTGEADPGQGTAEDFSAEDQQAEEELARLMQDDPDHLREEADRWKGLAQRHEKTARENAEAAKKWRTQEDANKSDLQRAIEAQRAAEEERDALRISHDGMMAAAAHDLDPALIDFLGGGTTEEITERAETLAGIIEASAKKLADQMVAQMNQAGRQPVMGTGRPVTSMRPGSAPAQSGPGTPDDLFRQLVNQRLEE